VRRSRVSPDQVVTSVLYDNKCPYLSGHFLLNAQVFFFFGLTQGLLLVLSRYAFSGESSLALPPPLLTVLSRWDVSPGFVFMIGVPTVLSLS